MPGPARSPAAQDHLKTIWSAGEWTEQPVTTTLLATRLGLSPSTVSEQVRRLVEAGLVRHDPYGPVELTADGEREALRVVRRHRLLETYLVAELGYTWDEVHAEAEVLEHVVSDLMLERMDVRLGHPVRDPHGDPIPTADGAVERPDARPLADLAPGQCAVVARVGDRDAGVLRWCHRSGVHPGVLLAVLGGGGEGSGTDEGGGSGEEGGARDAEEAGVRVRLLAAQDAPPPLLVPAAAAAVILVSGVEAGEPPGA